LILIFFFAFIQINNNTNKIKKLKKKPNSIRPDPQKNKKESTSNTASVAVETIDLLPKKQTIPKPELKGIKNSPVVIELSDSQTPPKANFKYVDSTRKKEDREKLVGRECELCNQFYDAIEGDYNHFDRTKFVHDCSKHRSKFTPPPTPPHMWDIGFPDSETQA